LLPASSALIVQVPVVKKLKAPTLVMLHTPVVNELKSGVKLELAVALSVGVAVKLWLPGLAKVIVCAAIGVTLLDALEAEPVPAELVAVTLKLYAVPLVSPATVKGELAPLAVKPPGLEVTV
jgi:hypothetical protein